MFTSTVCSIGPFWLNEPSIFLTYMDLSIFFSLNSYFLVNSKLITSPVAPLSNNASTIIPFWMSILSNPIFTVISLNNSSSLAFLTLTSFFLVPSEFDIPTSILVSIWNLLLESSQGTLDSPPLLNCPIVQNFPLFPTSVHMPTEVVFPASSATLVVVALLVAVPAA